MKYCKKIPYFFQRQRCSVIFALHKNFMFYTSLFKSPQDINLMIYARLSLQRHIMLDTNMINTFLSKYGLVYCLSYLFVLNRLRV